MIAEIVAGFPASVASQTRSTRGRLRQASLDARIEAEAQRLAHALSELHLLLSHIDHHRVHEPAAGVVGTAFSAAEPAVGAGLRHDTGCAVASVAPCLERIGGKK